MQVVGAAPSQLPSPKHVRVASPPLGASRAEVQEYVATLPTHWMLLYAGLYPTLWSSLYAIAMPLTADSSAQPCNTIAKSE